MHFSRQFHQLQHDGGLGGGVHRRKDSGQALEEWKDRVLLGLEGIRPGRRYLGTQGESRLPRPHQGDKWSLAWPRYLSQGILKEEVSLYY